MQQDQPGEWIRYQRKRLDLTQDALAKQLGFTGQTLKRIEAGRAPTHEQADKLVEIFSVPAAARQAVALWLRGKGLTPAWISETWPEAVTKINQTGGRYANLPAAPTALIGREEEVAYILAKLRRVELRLLTLTGPPGVGKTRLALQAAADMSHEFEKVIFVPLDPIRDPALLGPAIARALAIPEVPGQSLLADIAARLQDKQYLLVLDNFEQIAAAAHLVTDLIAVTLNVKVLLTSRERLHVYGEHEFSVKPLALADPRHLPPLDVLARVPTIALFVERAQAVAPGFSLSVTNAVDITELCAQLDGLPLAIELAAASCKHFSPSYLRTQMLAGTTRLQILPRGPRDRPHRQQTLRDSIAWSYELLDREEQVIFRRLAVFAGGCTVEAATAVCTEDKQQPLDVLNKLLLLVDKSLLRELADVEGNLRFDILATIREYARETLEAGREANTISWRHANYYLAAEHKKARQEHDNVRVAFDWVVAHGDPQQVSAVVASFWKTGDGWIMARKALLSSVGGIGYASLIGAPSTTDSSLSNPVGNGPNVQEPTHG